MDILVLSKTLQDQAYDKILDAICDGTLEPGQRLTQEEVAKRLNVSRQPITSALAMLKAHGFVQETGRRGVAVAPLDEKLFVAIYEFRSAIEPLVVRLAIGNLRGGDIERGREIIERGKIVAARAWFAKVDTGFAIEPCSNKKLEHVARASQNAACSSHDIKGLLQSDVDFHSFIYGLADNILISETMKLNWRHLRRSMSQVLRRPDFMNTVWTEHEAILDAMAEGDSDRAEKLIHDHVVSARQQGAPFLPRT